MALESRLWSVLTRAGRNKTLFFHHRNLFTRKFLGISFFLEKQKQLLLGERSDKNAHRQSIIDLVDEALTVPVDRSINAENERGNLLRRDMLELVYLSETPEEIMEAAVVLKKFVDIYQPWDSPNVLHRKSYLMRDFFGACHDKNLIEPVSFLWNDKVFMEKVGFEQDGKLGTNYPSVSLTYLDILYNLEMYDKVLEEVEILAGRFNRLTPWIWGIYMMSCMKINTKESFSRASNSFERHCPYVSEYGIVRNPYALLMLRQGDLLDSFNFAFSGRRTAITTNLMVHISSTMKNPDWGMRILEHLLKTVNNEEKTEKFAENKMTFSLETIEKLTEAVEDKSDAALSKRLANIFSQLDKIALIVDASLEELVSADVDEPKDVGYRRHKNVRRNQRSKTREMEDNAKTFPCEHNVHENSFK